MYTKIQNLVKYTVNNPKLSNKILILHLTPPLKPPKQNPHTQIAVHPKLTNF